MRENLRIVTPESPEVGARGDRLRRWLDDGVFRTVLRNAGALGSTKLVGALLGIVALSIVGRALGPGLFGTLTLIHAYALSAAALAKFQSWQLVIRYGAPAEQRGDHATVRDAINLAFGLDLASGVVGMLGAMALLPFVAPRFGIGRDWLPLALGYCTLVPTMSAATPVGTLRLLGRFDLTAWQQLVTPGLRVAGAAAAWASGFGFPAYVAAWYVADIAGDLSGWAFAIRELRRRDMLRDLRPRLFAAARRLPQVWSFVWTTNIAVSLNAAWGPFSNLIVGGVLGPVAAGLYRIALTVVESAGKPADLLTKGFYPELMRLDPAGDAPWRLALRTGAVAGGVGLLAIAIVLLGGRPLIGLVFGARYLPAYGLLALMVVALAVSMASFPLQSLLYLVGRQRAALAAQASAILLYLSLLAAACWRFGLGGAGAAYVAGNVLLAALMAVPVLGSYRNRARA